MVVNSTPIGRWLDSQRTDIGNHDLTLLSEVSGARASVTPELRTTFRDHYMSSDIWNDRLKQLGAPKTAEVLKELLPKEKKARSGDTGEVLATELAELSLGFRVPIRRLRWKDGRDMALRGDDIVGIKPRDDGNLEFLKGEAKSRVALGNSAITDAAKALDEDKGRPSRHSVLFTATRLREMGEDKLATDLELAVTNSFSGKEIEHLLFVVSGNEPRALLSNHLASISRAVIKRHAIGVRIPDHGQFIQDLYDGF